jgi:hypothetical protein
MKAAHSDTADTDNASGHLVTRSYKTAGRIAHLAEYFTWKYGQGAQSQASLLDEISSGLCHNQLCELKNFRLANLIKTAE